jgi:hypothetical protein
MVQPGYITGAIVGPVGRINYIADTKTKQRTINISWSKHSVAYPGIEVR